MKELLNLKFQKTLINVSYHLKLSKIHHRKLETNLGAIIDSMDQGFF